MTLKFKYEGEDVALYASNRRRDAQILRRKAELLNVQAQTIEEESYLLEQTLTNESNDESSRESVERERILKILENAKYDKPAGDRIQIDINDTIDQIINQIEG